MAASTEKSLVGDQIIEAQKAVEELYHFSEHYFESHSLDDASQKANHVATELQTTLKLLNNLTDINKNPQLLFLKGKAMNISPGFSQDCHDILSKAVKLDPSLTEAWIQLGESFWKQSDAESAKNCFIGALKKGNNKVALRNLSMVLRQLGNDEADRIQNILESVDKAKQAVQCDLNDGMSWMILGNAYFSQFFSGGQNIQLLKQCMVAYSKAGGDSLVMNNPDYYYNKSMAEKYQESYCSALEGFSRAAALDPTFKEAQAEERGLLMFLTNTQDMIQKKGKVKEKKVHTLSQSIKESDLGPFGGGNYTGANNTTVQLDSIMFDGLCEGANNNKVVLCKVVCSLTSSDTIPYTFCCFDGSGCCLAVNVYNVPSTFGLKLGDSVAIAEPYIQTVLFAHKDSQKFDFRIIRVEQPVVMVVNGRKIGLSKCAPTKLSATVKST